MADHIGIQHGRPFTDGWNEQGQHTSNPLAGPVDTYGFEGWGGRTDGDSGRSRVDHFQVDRQPMIAHPLGGPFPGAHCRPKEEGVI